MDAEPLIIPNVPPRNDSFKSRKLHFLVLVITFILLVNVFYILNSSRSKLIILVPYKNHADSHRKIANNATNAEKISVISYKGGEYTSTTKSNVKTERKKLILIYTNFFGERPWHFVQPHDNYSAACECDFTRCELTYDQNKFPQSDAVIFHARDMVDMTTLDKLDKERPPGQLWVYFVLESPFNAPPVKPLDKFFNLTADYRLSADARMPYARFRRTKRANLALQNINYAHGKTRQVAWLVSNCGTMRDQLAQKLEQNGIIIEVGGGCARYFKHQLKCSDRRCSKELRQFKFYFAAENSLCPGYVTEKYTTGITVNAIPIVLGGANYSNPGIAIPSSYIDSLKFRNVKELADYIKNVNNDDKKFNEYFQWKPFWEVEAAIPGCERFMCDLCQSIHKKLKKRKRPLTSRISQGVCNEKANNFRSWIIK